MTDSIVSCKVYKNPNGTVDRYDVNFEYDVDLQPNTEPPVITIFASEMQNPNDLNEVKSKAVAIACENKRHHVRECSMIVETIHTLDGNVTL